MKYEWSYQPPALLLVSTLAVEWIEIDFYKSIGGKVHNVSTLAEEWIEIMDRLYLHFPVAVSTLAVEWIEINDTFNKTTVIQVSTLAVEWIEMYAHHDINCWHQ